MTRLLASTPSPALPARRTTALSAWVLASAALLALPSHAGRPLATEDAGTVEAGACQLETWRESAKDSRGTWLNAGCNPWGQTEFALGGARAREDGAAAFTVQRWQVKHILRAFDDTQTGYGLAVGQQRVRGGDERQNFLNAIATVPLAGQDHLLHANLGTQAARSEGQRRNHATWGLAYDAEVREGTRAAVETFGTSGERANWQLGLRHELVPGRVQLDGSVGSAIGRWSSTRLVTVGLVFVTPAFLR